MIAEDIPTPSNLASEGRRVLFTFFGLAIGIVVLVLAGLLQRRTAQAAPAAATT